MPPGKEAIIYITRDIDRALGMEPGQGYYIVSNRTAYGESIAKKHPDSVILVDSPTEDSVSTGELIRNKASEELVARVTKASGAKPYILVFKNTERIEPIARERGWVLINPAAAAGEKIENKISQIAWLGELERYLPRHRIALTKDAKWQGRPFILQWAHGHTGGGTVLIRSEQELSALQAKFPHRVSRLSDYVDGPSFTVNVVASPDKILASSPSYQITGLPPFTESAFSTIGNDWGAAAAMLTAEDKATIESMAMEIGAKMQKDFWRGLFGIDIIRESSTGRLFLIEINARQPASTPFESELQCVRRAEGAPGMTTFEAHLAALMGRPISSLIGIDDGAQIIQRVTQSRQSAGAEAIRALELQGFTAIPYENRAMNSDLIRIQSKKSIMAGHGIFNESGKRIAETLDLR